jgi:septal ring factor EnvC (AmiA/AmiB activator)
VLRAGPDEVVTPVPSPEPSTASPAEAPAPAPVPGKGEDRKRELSALRLRLSTLRSRYATTRKREADIRQSLEAAELKLQIRTAERRELELRTAEAEKAEGDAVRFRDEARVKVGELRADLGARVATLYRMGRLGYLRTLATIESGHSFLRSLQVLSYQARKDHLLIEAYEKALTDLKGREDELGSRRGELKALVREARAKEAELSAARTEQADMLRRVSRAAEDERGQVATLENKTVRLEALLELLESRGRPLGAGAASIRKYRGALDWPARGKIAVPFGRIANPKFPKTFLRSSGWTIDVPSGTEAQAVFGGEVVYAQWLKGYGNLVVLDHGEGVFTLYGRLLPNTARQGDRVALGDRLGVVGEPPEDEVSGLYFEVRDSRASVDPQLWLR